MSPDENFSWPGPQPAVSFPPPAPPRPRRSVVPLGFAVTMLFVQFLLIGGAVLAWRVWIDPPYKPHLVEARGDLSAEEKATIELYNKTHSSVVHVTTLTDATDDNGLQVRAVPLGTGSGFVWNDAGFIVTNFHVVMRPDADRGADPAHSISSNVQVTLDDQSTYKAKVWGTYPDKDLAVLKIEAPRRKVPAVDVGKSSDLQVGQKVFAIGNPYGLDQTLTTGIVSALGREMESVTRRPIRNVIQTDAAINPGNSGGPLFDSAGRLIGVNTAIISKSGAFSGIGFALPVDEVRRVVDQLIEHKKITRAPASASRSPRTNWHSAWESTAC